MVSGRFAKVSFNLPKKAKGRAYYALPFVRSDLRLKTGGLYTDLT